MPNAGDFERLRAALTHVARDETLPPASKLSAHLQSLSDFASLGHASLIAYSGSMGFQTGLHTKALAPFAPSAAAPVPPYSVVHQISEIIQDEPDETTSRFSRDDSLPPDLNTIAQDEGLSEFLLQAVCSRRGNICALLVLGHADAAPFEDAAAWAIVHELLSVVLYDALIASALARFVTFAELLQLMATEADAMLFMDRWLPAVLVGPWSGAIEVAVALTLEASGKACTLYKATDVALPAAEDITFKDVVARSRSTTVHRMASVSKLKVTSVSGLNTANPGGVANTVAELLLPVAAQPGADQTPRDDPSTRGPPRPPKVCVFKHLQLAGSLMETVVNVHEVVSIPNVRQHVSEKAAGLPELLFVVNTEPPQSMLVLPMFRRDGGIIGGLYLQSLASNTLVTVQNDAETMLMVASEAIAAAMQPSTQSGRARRKQAVPKAMQAMIAAEQGKGHALRPFNDGSNVATLQRMFSGIITDPSRFREPPQVCRPENIRVESVAGTGAFAVVYRGRLDVPDTLVAVKVMPIDSDMDNMMLVRNATELAALSKIRHQNVVQIIAQFPECVIVPSSAGAGISFRNARPEDATAAEPPRRCCVLCMEFCTYGTLLTALQMDVFKHKNGMPNISSVCSVLLEISSALMHIHQHGIIHCDLKPQNVLLKADECSPRGFVSKLTDFGLARVVTRDQPLLCGDSAGTPSHLAPEIVKIGDQQSIKTAKSDIYAFGIVMWEMFTAQQAFWMVDKHAVLTHVVLDRKRLPFPAFADPKYVDLCERCWDGNMDKRPSLADIQNDLKDIMHDYAAHSRSAAAAAAVTGSAGPTAAPV